MKRFSLVLSLGCLLAVAGRAQDIATVLARGEQQFVQTCSSGYCHGDRGVGGGAPRLAARGFTQAFINSTVRNGVPGTGMAAFAGNLNPADLNAIIAYVASLNGVTNPVVGTAPASAAPALSADGAQGEVLFSDAVRGFGRCSTCHQVGRLGIPVATPIFNIPANAAALKSLETPRVGTATVGGQTMPVLVVAQRADGVQFYDLTSSPPVLRNELPANVQIGTGSTWRHSSVMGGYSDAELTAILSFVREVVK